MVDEFSLTFGIIRKYCSKIDRISVCMEDTMCYENFEKIEDVPHCYDDLFLIGFGIIDSEISQSPTILKQHMEIMLSKVPRSVWEERLHELHGF